MSFEEKLMPASTSSFDSVLNWLIPALLILVVVWFIWSKFLQPTLWPAIVKLWNKLFGEKREDTGGKNKEITFE